MHDVKHCEAQQPEVMKYKIRPGVINNGKKFEFKVTALLCLRCVLKNQGKMWIASNAPSVGAFDDIVLYFGNTTFLLQLKHKETPNTIEEDELLLAKGDFALLKYFKDVAKLNVSLDDKNESAAFTKYLSAFDNIYFVIFTNRKVSNCKFLKQVNHSALSFLNTKSKAKMYKVDVSNLTEYVDQSHVNNYNRIYLLANQVSAHDLDKLLVEEIAKITKHLHLPEVELKNVSERFTQFIVDWAEGNLGLNFHYCLTETEILQKLAELLLSKYEIGFFGKPFTPYTCQRKLLWNRFIANKTVTVVENKDGVLQFLMNCIGAEIGKYCVLGTNPSWNSDLDPMNLEMIHQNSFLSWTFTKIVRNSSKVSPSGIYRWLYMIGKLPLLLKIDKEECYTNVLHILELVGFCYKVIIITENKELKPLKNANCFFTMQDLLQLDQFEILKLTVNLQTRPNAVLGDVIDDSMFHYISCGDIIDIMLARLNIGHRVASLIDHFIERKISKILLKREVLEILKEEVFVIEGALPPFLSNIKRPNTVNLEKFNGEEQEITALNKTFQSGSQPKAIHHLIGDGEDTLEWRASFGSLKNIRYFQYDSTSKLDGSIVNRESSKLTILSAWPGMGKSVSMDYLVRYAPVNVWVLKVDLNAHQKYYRSNNARSSTARAEQHLNYFNDFLLNQQKSSTDLAKAVFQKFIRSKNVVVLLDGFDEVSVSYKMEVINIAQALYREGHRVWITTRPHMKAELEDEFNTFSINLQPFTVDDQKLFLTKYYSDCEFNSSSCSNSLILNFVDILLEAAKKHLSDADSIFTGVPLQTKLLADVFKDNFQLFVSNPGNGNFINDFDLVYLYKNFISRKIDILCERFGESSIDLFVMFKEHHQLFALRLLFPLNDDIVAYTDKQLEYYTNHPKKMELLQKTGLVVVEEGFSITFAHRTFAEYLSAKWLSNNSRNQDKNTLQIAQVIYKERFSQNHKFLFSLFDRIVTQNCRLHIAVISKQVEEVERLVKSHSDVVIGTDRIGRTVLHITALYGMQFPPLLEKYRQSFTCYEGKLFVRSEAFKSDTVLDILEKLPEIKLEDTSDILGYSPLDYALGRFSLTIAERIHTKLGISVINIYIDLKLKHDYLGYCMLLNYNSLFHLLLIYFASKDLLVNRVKMEDLLESYIEDALGNLFSISERDRSLCHRMKVQEKTILELLYSPLGNIYTGYVSDDYYLDLRYATAFGSKSNINDLLSKEAHVNRRFSDGNRLLHYAVLHGNLETANLLLCKGAKVNEANADDNTALHLAVANRDVAIVASLLAKGGDINAQNDDQNTPLHLALLNLDIPMAMLILSNDPDVNLENCNNESVLHVATYVACDNVVNAILEKGADVDKLNRDWETPIFSAVRANQLSVVKLLTDSRADVNVQNKAGETVLHVAAYNAYDDIIRELMFKNADIDRRDNCGNTPLFYAVEKNDVHTVELLISSGADVNLQYNKGQTVLHLAIFWEYYEAVKTIISQGSADVNRPDVNGRTPLCAAVTKNNRNIIELLMPVGAKLEVT